MLTLSDQHIFSFSILFSFQVCFMCCAQQQEHRNSIAATKPTVLLSHTAFKAMTSHFDDVLIHLFDAFITLIDLTYNWSKEVEIINSPEVRYYANINNPQVFLEL